MFVSMLHDLGSCHVNRQLTNVGNIVSNPFDVLCDE